MAKPLVFQFGDCDLSFDLSKIDRDRLYGYKITEAVDSQNRRCELATLINDGQTVLGTGGTGLGYRTVDGQWREKSQLSPVDSQGNVIQPVGSSFGSPIKLFDVVTVDEYFQHNIKSVYRLTSPNDFGELMTELQRGTIFTFPFSYRGGLEADVGFLLCNEAKDLFLVVGVPTKSEWVGLQQMVSTTDDQEDSEEVDLMDFDMI